MIVWIVSKLNIQSLFIKLYNLFSVWVWRKSPAGVLVGEVSIYFIATVSRDNNWGECFWDGWSHDPHSGCNIAKIAFCSQNGDFWIKGIIILIYPPIANNLIKKYSCCIWRLKNNYYMYKCCSGSKLPRGLTAKQVGVALGRAV